MLTKHLHRIGGVHNVILDKSARYTRDIGPSWSEGIIHTYFPVESGTCCLKTLDVLCDFEGVSGQQEEAKVLHGLMLQATSERNSSFWNLGPDVYGPGEVDLQVFEAALKACGRQLVYFEDYCHFVSRVHSSSITADEWTSFMTCRGPVDFTQSFALLFSFEKLKSSSRRKRDDVDRTAHVLPVVVHGKKKAARKVRVTDDLAFAFRDAFARLAQ